MNNFICPNFSNKEVFDEFNQMIEAFGGKAMTMDECKSGELRSQRTGLDYSAMEFAYKVYNMNGGNSLHYAPNGEESILFNQLLNNLGDVKQALLAKSYFYTEEYDKNKSNYELDINGEPVFNFDDINKNNNILVNKFNVSSSKAFFGDVSDSIMSGDVVSSRSIINNILNNNMLSDINIPLAQIIQRHNIPTKISSLPGDDFMTTYTDEKGQSVVLINPVHIGKASNKLTADTYLHEVVHALTVNALNNPNTEEETSLKKYTDSLYSIYDKMFPKETYDRSNRASGFYALQNQKEFIAEFITNPATRDLLYSTAIHNDQKNKKTIIGKIKRFINAITKFLVNKQVFVSEEQKLKDYEKQIKSYLIASRQVSYTKYKPSSIVQLLQNKISDVVVANDDAIIMSRQISDLVYDIEQNKATYVEGRPFNSQETKERLDKMCDEVAKILKQRLAAIKSSNLSQEQITQNTEILESQIQQFKMRTISHFDIVAKLLTQLMPQLLEDVRHVRPISDKNESMSHTEYMYYAHDNFGTYIKALEQIQSTFDARATVDYLTDSVSNEDNQNRDSIIKDFDTLDQAIKKAKALAELGKRCCDNILITSVRKTLRDVGDETNSLEMADYLDQLEKTTYDTNIFFQFFGSPDKAKDQGLRSIFHLVDKAIKSANAATSRKSSQLLKLQEDLSSGELVKYLYEYDNDNQTTGYLVRKYNYGQFYKDYNKFIKELNASMGLPLSNRIAPENDTIFDPSLPEDQQETMRQHWNNQRNDWLADHCERRFTKEYYKAYANLSQITRDRREELQSQIRLIKQKALGDPKTDSWYDGYYHYERLSDHDYNRLQDLYIQKRILKDDRDINGDLKTGTELQIAKELQQLDNLYKNKADENRNFEKWKQMFQKVYEECGGDVEYDKGKDGNFDFERYNKWIDRNCEKTLKRDSQGRVLLFKRMSEEVPETPVYEINGDGGATYESLKREYNEILNARRDFATGDVRASNVSIKVTAKLKSLEKQMADIKKKAKQQNGDLRKLAYKKAQVFKKYARSEKTALYKKLEDEARAGGYLEAFRRATGYYAIDEFGDDTQAVFVPNRWYTKIMPRDEYMNEFFDIKPGKGWVDYEEDNEYVNPRFKELESEGEKMVPKAFDEHGNKMYDNSEAYKRATSGKLGKLYNAILGTMKDANSRYTNRQYACDYLLPQIPGSVFKRMRGKDASGKWNAIKDYIREGIGVDDVRYFDIQYGQHLEDILDNYDEFGNILQQDNDTFGSETIHGRRPDGRELHMIPQYYTRKLRDPSQISSDIVGITCEYYKQAITFENKQQVKDTCEALLDIIEKRTIEKTRLSIVHRKKNDEGQKEGSMFGSVKLGTKTVQGDQSTTYAIARQFLNTHMYNIKLDPQDVNVGWYTFRLGKFAQAYRALTTAINLGCNLAVAGTGFLTSAGAHLVQLIVGRRYGLRAGTKAFIEQVHQFSDPSNGGVMNYISNRTSKNKLMVLAETYNLSNQLSRKYKHSNRNRAFNAINENWCFGMMTSLDFVIKTNIMLTVIMSYQMYNGEFLTEEELKLKLWDKSVEEKKAAELERRNGIYLYDVMKTNKGHLEIYDPKGLSDNEYKRAYDKIKSKLDSKINKWAEDADGMATETQKAAITTNFVGAAILTHRQYLPLVLQNRFGHTIEDMDTEMYDGGVFRSGAQAIKLMTMPLYDMFTLNYKVGKLNESSKYQALLGAAMGAAVDATLLSTPFSFMGLLLGSSLGVLSSMDSKQSQKFNQYFNDKSSKKSYALSRARRAHLKQIAVELMLYHLFITPIINALAAFADDDDDDKDKVANAIVKYMMYLIGADSDSNAIQLAAYLGRRFQWEFYTAYRAEDMLNNIKTVSAQTGTNDKIETVLTQAYKTVMPRETLLDTFLNWYNNLSNEDLEDDSYVKRGLYSDSELRQYLFGDPRWTKLEKALFKLFPLHHTYEQIFDSKSKRRYHENQIMKINK